MHQFLISLVFMLYFGCSSLGQVNYLEKGNKELNAEDFAAAEQTFRNAIRSDSANLIYQSQLALSLIRQKKHEEAQQILDRILLKDSANTGALWYAGTNKFLDQKADLRHSVYYFEKVLPLLKENQGQYYSAQWFIGRSYQILLQTDGLTYNEVSRMLDCYSGYVQLQPMADDAAEIAAFIRHIKDIRPSDNVKKWINKQQ